VVRTILPREKLVARLKTLAQTDGPVRANICGWIGVEFEEIANSLSYPPGGQPDFRSVRQGGVALARKRRGGPPLRLCAKLRAALGSKRRRAGWSRAIGKGDRAATGTGCRLVAPRAPSERAGREIRGEARVHEQQRGAGDAIKHQEHTSTPWFGVGRRPGNSAPKLYHSCFVCSPAGLFSFDVDSAGPELGVAGTPNITSDTSVRG
jgi:hypothetical protein